MQNPIKITEDERIPHKVGSDVVIKIRQTQRMPFINCKNMVDKWKEYNLSANDFIENQYKILEESIKVAKSQSVELKKKSESFLNMSEEDKAEFLKKKWEKEVASAKNNIDNHDKIVEGTIEGVKKQHEDLLMKIKTEVKNNNAGIKVYGKVLKNVYG